MSKDWREQGVPFGWVWVTDEHQDKEYPAQLHYPAGQRTEWGPAKEFEATLRWRGFRRGRSAAYVHWQDTRHVGTFYTMFLTDLDDLIQHTDIVGGKVRGRWDFCKRGANYGIYLVSPIKDGE